MEGSTNTNWKDPISSFHHLDSFIGKIVGKNPLGWAPLKNQPHITPYMSQSPFNRFLFWRGGLNSWPGTFFEGYHKISEERLLSFFFRFSREATWFVVGGGSERPNVTLEVVRELVCGKKSWNLHGIYM